MNSCHRAFAILVCALCLVSIPVFADDTTDGSMNQEQAGEMGSDRKESKAKMTDEAKRALAPHTVTIESSLSAALDQVRGLKNGLKIAENQPPSPAVVKHLQVMGKGLNDDLKTAKIHQGELQAGVKKFPEIAASSDYQEINAAVSDAEKFGSTFQANLGSTEYFGNPAKVMGDLDNLERRLNKAIDETKTFSSSQLDFSFIG